MSAHQFRRVVEQRFFLLYYIHSSANRIMYGTLCGTHTRMNRRMKWKKKNTKTTNFCCCCDDDDDNTSYAWTQKLTKWLSVFKQLHEVSNHYIRFFPILLVVVLSVFATIEHSKRRQNNNPMMISRAFCLSLSQCVRNETVCYFYIDTQSWNRERTTEELKWAEKKTKTNAKSKR